MNCTLDTTDNTNAARRRTRRPIVLAALAAGLLVTSSCALPFGDEGEDISADVNVGGAQADGVEDGEDQSVSKLDTEGAQLGSTGQQDESTTVPTTEAAPADNAVPVETVDTRFNGRSMQYLGIDIELGDFTTTDQTLDQYLGSLPATDEAEYLLVEVAVTNRSSGTVSIPKEVLGLRLPSGEWVAAEEMRERDGDRVTSAQPATQATERVLLQFPATDLTGASFEISQASTIAESIPLTAQESPAVTSTIELEVPEPVADLESPSLWPACGYIWTGEVVSARVTVEGVDRRQLERATKGQRWVGIELRATYQTDTISGGFSPCDDYGLAVNEIAPRLIVDGLAESPLNSVAGDRLNEGDSATTVFWFQVPVETEQIELTDVGGTRIAGWTLALPLLDGEA